MVRYPVFPSPFDLKDLVPFPITGRDPILPPLYRFCGASHPQRPKKHVKGIYIYFIDPSPQGKAFFISMMEAQRIPPGRTDKLIDCGI